MAPAGTAAAAVMSAELDKVCLTGMVKQLACHTRCHPAVPGLVQYLIAQVAWVAGTQVAMRFDVVLLDQIAQPIFTIGNLLRLANTAENLAVLIRRGIRHLYLMADAPQKRVIDQILGRHVGR